MLDRLVGSLFQDDTSIERLDCSLFAVVLVAFEETTPIAHAVKVLQVLDSLS